MNQPKVSIIVPIYKVEKYLRQCIDSILNQTLKEIEIILVDEGDIDPCRFIINYYENKDPRVIAIHEKNGGYGASCNKAMKRATGEYIGIVESDDFIDDKMYEEMYSYAKKIGADIVKTPFYEFYDQKDDKINFTKLCHYAEWITKNSPDHQFFSILDYPHQMAVHASNWSGIYKKSYLDKKNIQFIEAKGASYVDVMFRIETFMNTQKSAWLNKPFYYYRCTNTDSSTNTFKLFPMLQRWNEAHNYFEKNFKKEYSTVGKYLIIDEYLNTIGQTRNIGINQDEYKILKDNLSFIDNDIIENSPVLNFYQKQDIINAKKCDSFSDYFLLISKKNSLLFRNKPLKWYSSPISINKKGFFIQLLRGIPMSIIKLDINILKYKIKFSVGALTQ